jgi:hypothetical protein
LKEKESEFKKELEAKTPVDAKVEESSPTKTQKKVQFQDTFSTMKMKKLTADQSAKICEEIAYVFVEDKKEKMRSCVSWYLWLQRSFTQPIMFKNQEDHLGEVKTKLAQGDPFVPTELERIMMQEAKELIFKHYDNVTGAQELYVLLNQTKKSLSLRERAKVIMEKTELDRKYKLSKMPKTFEFTRPGNMCLHYLEVFFAMLISNTEPFIYLAMIYAMFMNRGIIAIFYPIAVFGFALMEENRPSHAFWRVVRLYTTGVLIMKFIFNLGFFDSALQCESFIYYRELLKLGIYDFENMVQLVFYMMPEILILILIMLNEIRLRIVGLYFNCEGTIEPILDAVQRNLKKGDEEAVAA